MRTLIKITNHAKEPDQTDGVDSTLVEVHPPILARHLCALNILRLNCILLRKDCDRCALDRMSCRICDEHIPVGGNNVRRRNEEPQNQYQCAS